MKFLCNSGEFSVEAGGHLAWGRGIGTATLEAKLAQHLAVLAHEPLFQVLLEIPKAYDSLDRGRCLEVV